MSARFPLSGRARLSVQRVGREGEGVLIADGVSAVPGALVDAAAASRFAPAYGPEGGYPGVRAAAPLDYVGDVVRWLIAPMREAFDLGPVRARRAECNFSLVTLSPDRLVPAQRAPHVDTADPAQFAILHYLCGPGFGGTAFFRHRATGYETIRPDRLARYEAVRAGEVAGRGYAGADDPAFERVGEVDAVFDRIVVYRSRLLHSGSIADPARLSDDPRRGRLTANIFLTVG